MEAVMTNFLIKLADKLSSKLIPTTPRTSEHQAGALLYHDNGSISLNLANNKVQRKITHQLEALARIDINKSNHS